MKDILQQLLQGKDLTEAQANQAFTMLLEGNIPESVIGAFLAMLAQKGESVTEIFAGMKILHDKSTKLNAPIGAMDIVGTGGDGLGTYNISTNSAIIVASVGVPIAKHGSSSVSSASGASDVLTALGVNINAPANVMEQSLQQHNIAFMFAPHYHPAMKNVMPTRKALAIRTIFNFLGPICNPASVRYLLVGTSEKKLLQPYAEVLKLNQCERFLVVHAENRMDELSLSCPTDTIFYDGKKFHEATITPEDVGLTRCAIEDLQGGSPDHNAQKIRAMLDGEQSPYADCVLMNAGAALWVANQTDNLTDGIALARASIASGKAKATLQAFIDTTNI